MTKIKDIGNCSRCNKQQQILLSNNPLVKGICMDCLTALVDPHTMVLVDSWCKTFNLPFLPDKWLEIVDSGDSDNPFEDYIEVITAEYANTLYNSSSTELLWEKVDKEYQRVRDHRLLLSKLSCIREEFEAMMIVKWGANFNFEQWLKLENLYNNMASRAGTTNAITLDLFQKIAKTSVMQDECLEIQDIKGAGELSKMVQTMIKSAGLEDMVDATGGDTIANISDLCSYLEEIGWVPKYYDGTVRDKIDETLQDIKNFITTFVRESVGFDQDFELINNAYTQSKEMAATDAATSSLTIEEIIKQGLEKRNDEFDAEFTDGLDFGEVGEEDE